jgi:hypothetical protein
MIELTLKSLGNHLIDVMELPIEQIKYTDKETLFQELTNLTLPAVSYCAESFTDPNQRKNLKIKMGFNDDQTVAKTYRAMPIAIGINLCLACSSFDTHFYFKYIKKIWLLNLYRRVFYDDFEGLRVTHVIDDLTDLSTPPSRGREGKYYDRAKYYILETTFKVNSYVMFEKESSVIRKTITTSWDVSIDEALKQSIDLPTIRRTN